MVPPRLGAGLGALGMAGCAALSSLGGIEPLRFSEPDNREPELRLVGPSLAQPAGGALRLWARIENPNGFGVTLSEVAGHLRIEDAEAIAVDFPLGLPLVARQDTVIPLDVSIRFDDLPRLARLVLTGLTGTPLAYRLDGTFTVDAGALGAPRFGPLTLLRGNLRVR